jgi:hypothetical protein
MRLAQLTVFCGRLDPQHPDDRTAQPTKNEESKTMNHQFDELTKGMAQSVTRRAALKKFGVGLAGMALACFGLANKAEAEKGCWPNGHRCTRSSQCCSGICFRWSERWAHCVG